MKLGVREWLFSANCFVAAMLALFVSFSLGLERPFWAMMTVYITSQPLSGAVRSKAVFRLGGTVIGAAATVLIVPPLSNAPVLLSIALALWVAGCQYLSLLDRTPRAYLFMLAGYTAALIGFPSVAHPETVFQTGILRAQEIGIGVTCAAFVHAIVFPRSVSAVLAGRVGAVMREAEAWLADALSLEEPARAAAERRRLAADVTELHAMAIHVPFDTAARRPTQRVLTALQERLALLLPLVSAIEDRTRSLRALGPSDPALVALLADVRAWTADPQPGGDAALRTRAAALADAQAVDDWAGLLRLNLIERLAELVDAWEEAVLLARHVQDPDAPSPARALARRTGRPLHLDHGLALVSAAATVVAILGCCAFWIMTAWPDGATAAMIAAVASCFFATMDDPVPAQRGFLAWTAYSLPIAAIYLFAILPQVSDFVTLVLVLSPVLLLLGAIMALPHWYGRIMPFMLGIAGGLALTNHYAADAAAFLNGSMAQLIGVAAAMIATRLLRSMGAATAIARLRRAGWHELARGATDAASWPSRMLDRVGLIAARLGEVADEDRDAARAALRELRVGVNLSQLGDVPEVRDAVAAHFRARDPDAAPPAPELLARIDAAIDARRGEGDRRVLAALTGLRRNFFPAAPAWQAQEVAA
jgi:uncharacterized membrane protein YccC